MIAMECQIEANPSPSYVWYELLNNVTSGQSVFGTTRQIQRIYQYPGHYAMQCQAQSRGKTIKQEFSISVICKELSLNFIKTKIYLSSTSRWNENQIEYRWKSRKYVRLILVFFLHEFDDFVFNRIK
jgi:hypothetical protein